MPYCYGYVLIHGFQNPSWPSRIHCDPNSPSAPPNLQRFYGWWNVAIWGWIHIGSAIRSAFHCTVWLWCCWTSVFAAQTLFQSWGTEQRNVGHSMLVLTDSVMRPHFLHLMFNLHYLHTFANYFCEASSELELKADFHKMPIWTRSSGI